MATNRYQHLRPRVRANKAPYRASIATVSKEKEELELQKKLESWNNLNQNGQRKTNS